MKTNDTHNAFENEIFHYYRVKQAEVKRAMTLLKEQGYKVYEEREVKI